MTRRQFIRVLAGSAAAWPRSRKPTGNLEEVLDFSL